MAETRSAYIFHVCRGDGTAVFLHPFRSRDDILRTLEHAEVYGRYGREPDVETVNLMRSELYRLIDSGIREWLNDVRFIPRFLLSSGAFLAVYLFLSFAVRDPVPLFDEFLLSFAGAFAVYAFVGRRNLHSHVANQKRTALRSRVDAVIFTESHFVAAVERQLAEMEDEDEVALMASALAGLSWQIAGDDEEGDEADRLFEYLARKFSRHDLRRQEQRLLERDADFAVGLSTAALTSLIRWLRARNVDLPLYALYLRLRREKIGAS